MRRRQPAVRPEPLEIAPAELDGSPRQRRSTGLYGPAAALRAGQTDNSDVPRDRDRRLPLEATLEEQRRIRRPARVHVGGEQRVLEDIALSAAPADAHE